MTINTKKALISIAIFYDNNVLSLMQTLESLYTQTWKNLEIIIVDDVSLSNNVNNVDDGSNHVDANACSDVLKKFKANGLSVKILHQTQQSFTLQARLEGMKEARGDFLFFLDAADYFLHEDALEKIVEAAQINSAEIFHFTTMVKRKWGIYPLYNSEKKLKNKRIEAKTLFKEFSLNPASGRVLGKMYSKELYERIRKMMPSPVFYYHEDLYLSTHFFFHARSYFYCDMQGYLHQQQNKNDLQTLIEYNRDTWKLFSEFLQIFATWGPDQENYDAIKNYICELHMLNAGHICRQITGEFDKHLLLPEERFSQLIQPLGTHDLCASMLLGNAINVRKRKNAVDAFVLPQRSKLS